MATITIPTFGGEVPRTTPRLLAETQASIAINCQLQRGALEALKGPAKVQSLESSAKTIFKHDMDGWLTWPGVVHVVKSAVHDVVNDNPLGHLFITGERGYPTQYFAGGQTYRLGVPRPQKSPILSGQEGAVLQTVRAYAFGANSDADFPARYGEEDTLRDVESSETATVTVIAEQEDDEPTGTDSGIARSSAYVYTLVQSLAGGVFQQESAPSPATAVIDVMDGEGVLVSGFEIPELDGLNVTHIRIYRTSSGAESSEFHLLAEIPASQTSYLDTMSDVDLSSKEVLATTTWDEIPDDAQGLILADNGLYACFRGNELLLSEPFIAYAYPTDYRLTTVDPIIALAHVDGTIVVLTTGRPYLVAGSEPAQMQITYLPIEQACISARSVSSLPGGVVYASPDGLMLFSSSEQNLLTAQTWTREQWQNLKPDTLMGTVHEGRYVGFFEGTNLGFLLSLGAKDVTRIELPHGWQVRDVYHHSNDDCVYISGDTPKGHGIWQLEAGELLTYRWRSKPFFTSALTGMSAVRIQGEQSPRNMVTVKVYGPDPDRVRTTGRIGDSRTRRLPTTRAERVWSVELTGTVTVFEARIGGSVEGLEYGN